MKKESSGRFKAQGLSLRDAVVVLFRHKWLIILTFLTTAAAAFILAYSMPDNYESRMKILVRNMRSDVVVSPDQTDASSNDVEISESQIVSEIELLKSRDLLEQVVKNTNLAQFETKGEPTAQDVEKAVYRTRKRIADFARKKSKYHRSKLHFEIAGNRGNRSQTTCRNCISKNILNCIVRPERTNFSKTAPTNIKAICAMPKINFPLFNSR